MNWWVLACLGAACLSGAPITGDDQPLPRDSALRVTFYGRLMGVEAQDARLRALMVDQPGFFRGAEPAEAVLLLEAARRAPPVRRRFELVICLAAGIALFAIQVGRFSGLRRQRRGDRAATRHGEVTGPADRVS